MNKTESFLEYYVHVDRIHNHLITHKMHERIWKHILVLRKFLVVLPFVNVLKLPVLWVKVWLGYQKRLSPFVSNGLPHLKHVVIT